MIQLRRRIPATTWFGVAVLAVLAPYAVLAFYAHPSADDLTYALTTQRDGYWTAYRDQFFNWNGRFTSNFLELGGPMVWGSTTAYRLAGLLMIVGTGVSMYAIVRVLTRDVWTIGEAIAAALGLTALDLGSLPTLGENVYWYTGAATYQLAPILIALQVAVTIPLLTGDTSHRRVRTAAAVVLLVAAVGMTEVAMLIVVAFYAVLASAAIIDNRTQLRQPALLMLGVSALAGIVVWLAPGNSVRGSLFPARHELIRSGLFTVLQTVRFAAEWATSGPLLLASLLYIPCGRAIARRSAIFQGMTRVDAVLLAIGAFATIPLAVFPAYWATGMLGQHRTISVAYFVFLLLWFAALTAMLAVGWLAETDGWLQPARSRWTIAVLLIASLPLTRNGYGVIDDLRRGRAAAFDRQMSRRYETLKICQQHADASCELERIVDRPESFSVLDVSHDPTDWVNAAYAGYFHVREVRAAAQGGSH